METKESISALFPVLESVSSKALKDKIVACWLRAFSESPWERIADCPFNPHFPDVSLVDHVNCVAALAMSAADTLTAYNKGLSFDRDRLIAGVLLHDVSKLVEIERRKDGSVGFAPLTRKMPHATYGAIIAMAEGLPADIANMILSHTTLTGARPDSPEAVLLHYLDYGMADVLRADKGLPLIMVEGSTFGRK